MKHKLLLSLFALLTTTMAWADVEINETNFPDANFRNYLLRWLDGADGVFTASEIANVTSMNLPDICIENLQGIEYFTALKTLNFTGNQVRALDVSKNTKLEKLYCGNNQLTALDVSHNTALTELYCYRNKLTALDLSQNANMKEVWCYQNQIKGEAMDALVESLPDRSNRTLKVIYNENEGNVMTVDQVAAAKAKGWIPRCYDGNSWQEYAGSEPVNNDIAINETSFPDENFRNWVLSQSYGADSVLTPSEIASLTSIDVSNKGIKSLQGIEFFTALTELRCYNNQLTALDVSKNTELTNLYCYKNQLTELDMSGCTALTELNCYGNQLTELDVSKNTALTNLYCYKNQLTELDVSMNTALRVLSCLSNYLTALVVSKNTLLEYLYCYENQLTTLDVSGCTTLKELYCYDNLLMTLDLSGCTTLTRLDCYTNQLETLDVSGCSALGNLYCYKNQLTTLDVSECSALGRLHCYENQLTALDVSGCSALGSLYCNENQLTELNVSECTALHDLSCCYNQLTAIDVSKNTALTYLHCGSNQLTALDVSENKLLEYLFCYQNQIKDEAMDALVASLPTVNKGSLRVIYNENEGNVMTVGQVAAAKAKGWIPYYCSGIYIILGEKSEKWEKYDGSTGISLIPALSEGEGEIYDLSGRRLSRMQRGVNIVNGRKILR